MFDELEVVDLPPAELLQWIAEDAILTPAERALAMQQELQPSVLAMLRETALVSSPTRSWLAESLEEVLQSVATPPA